MSDDNNDVIYSVDKLGNMNYIWSEDKFYCTLCEFSSNTVEYLKKHFDEKHESDEIIDGNDDDDDYDE